MSQDPRKVAAQVIEHILKHKSFSKIVLSNALDKSHLSDRDKALCTELVYGTLRWLPSLELSVNRAMNRPNPKLQLDLKCHLLIAAYQIQHLEDSIPAYAAVSTAVKHIKKKRPGMAGFANAILRNLGSSPHLSLKSSDSLETISKALGLPIFVLEALPQDDLLEAALAMNSRPQTWYRQPGCHPGLACPIGYDPGSSSSDTKLDPGSEAGVTPQHPFVPTATLSKTPYVQDPASQLAGLLVAPKPGDYVIDACAAPGSKSRILKEAVGDSGRVIAVDQDAKRLAKVPDDIEKINGDFCKLKLEPADAVLLDAPCSGYGTLRRHPEIKFWRTHEDVQRLAALQSELLDAAVKVIKPGGVLVYSVCSPLPEEGSKQIAAFLEKHSEFGREDPKETLPWLPEHVVNDLSEITLWPHRDESDAFFAVKLRRR